AEPCQFDQSNMFSVSTYRPGMALDRSAVQSQHTNSKGLEGVPIPSSMYTPRSLQSDLSTPSLSQHPRTPFTPFPDILHIDKRRKFLQHVSSGHHCDQSSGGAPSAPSQASLRQITIDQDKSPRRDCVTEWRSCLKWTAAVQDEET
ncbi:7450_t:CDS:2, partial [Acaulospora colombiana]